MREVIPEGSVGQGLPWPDGSHPNLSGCISGRGERGGVCVRVCRGEIIPSLSRNLLKCAWAFKGSPIVSKWNMVVNKQLLLTQLWVVRGVCFCLLLVSVNHF